MADFRRWFIALAVLALMAGLASAQVGIAGSTIAGPLTCTGNAAATPQLRSEGYTELVGDVLITCTGGGYSALGGQIPTTNITLYVTPNIPITSRLFSGSSTGVGEPLLIIDDPGSSEPTGAIGPFGPSAPQQLCADTAGTGGCPAYVGLDNSGSYYVACSISVTSGPCNAGSGTNAKNVYQGNINQVGSNSVTFYGVPSLAPVTSGVSRTFRITNVRVPTVGMGNQATIQVYISTSASTVLPISLASLQVGIVADPGLKTAIFASGSTKTTTPIVNLQQCVNTAGTATVDLVYTEGFATSFKTRMVPLSNALWASQNQGNNTPSSGGSPGVNAQNIPGGLYGGFAQNSESGFIFNQLTGANGSTTYTAGLADFGTRLKAVFTNIPAGITLYVSGGNKEATTSYAADFSVAVGDHTGIFGGTSTASAAVLWSVGSSGNGETTRDGTSFSPVSSTYAVGATVGSTTVYTPTLVQLVPNSSNVATAIWEVVNSNPASVENFTFTVYVGFPSNPGGGITSSNPYGLPQITTILGAPVNNVAMSFAPEPSQGAFSASAATNPGTNPIPRFAVVHPFSGPFVSIILCQTTLLYPFVTANPSGGLGQGFDTGIAVANTSMDPFTKLGINTTPASGTLAEVGSCTLYPYGVSISATGVQTAAPNPLPGCDTITNPVPGTNCFPVVASGSVQTVLASQVFPTFQGYVIAVCNFQYAHGYAAVTDLGLRGLFSSYLAIELNFSTAVGQPRGVSIEFNDH